MGVPDVFVGGFWYFFSGYLGQRTARTDGPQICLKGQISTAVKISLVTIKSELTRMSYIQFHFMLSYMKKRQVFSHSLLFLFYSFLFLKGDVLKTPSLVDIDRVLAF